jgi:hypothetical protein
MTRRRNILALILTLVLTGSLAFRESGLLAFAETAVSNTTAWVIGRIDGNVNKPNHCPWSPECI